MLDSCGGVTVAPRFGGMLEPSIKAALSETATWKPQGDYISFIGTKPLT